MSICDIYPKELELKFKSQVHNTTFLDLDSKEGFKEGGFLYISYLIRESPFHVQL